MPMAGMKRFVTYIYAYEEGKKGSNIGFAKIEIRGEDCRVEVHLRGAYVAQAVCEVYLFRVREGRMEGVRIGEIRLVNGKGDGVVVVKAAHLAGTSLGIGDMEGIVLLGGDGQNFLSRWKEGAPFTVDREHFSEWRPEEKAADHTEGGAPQPENMAVSAQKEQPARENGASAQSRRTEPTAGEPLRKREEAGVDMENVQMTELPVRNIFPAYDWQIVWEKLRENRPVFMPFADRTAACVQIELKDIRELPRRYWYLGNNSFLLHGFFNYQYLVIGKTGDARWFLGVPGIYQSQERVMAAIFGFPEFMPAAAGETPSGEEPVNRFGCWYRYMEE